MLRPLPFAVSIAFLACRGSTSDSPASGDAKSATETAAAACAPISGTTPFGVHLGGSGVATDSRDDAGSKVHASVDVYFPNGRVSGGEVLVVRRKYDGSSTVVRATLDSTLSARELTVFDSDCRDGITGDLIGPSGGISAVATNNLTAPSDALKTISGPVVLCATGDVPAQKIEYPPPAKTTPLDQITVGGTRPFASSSFAAVSAKTASGLVALKVTAFEPGVLIASATSFSWYTPTTIDLSGLRDVLGAPLGLSSIEVEVPTAIVSDLGFATELAAGSSVGDRPVVNEGKLVVGGVAGWKTAIAIGSVAGKTKLRLRHRLDCEPMESPIFSGGVLSSDGKSISVLPKCGATPIDETIALPGVGPYVLIVGSPTYRSRPCNYPSRGGSPAIYEADELAFE